jgi:tetratricopeptide (TPR) repeat protein
VQRDIYLKPRRTSNNAPFQNAVIFAQDIPKEAEDYYKRALEDLDNKRISSGVENLEKAVASFPKYFMALQRLGIVRLVQNRFEEAADVFNVATTINDRCFDCWYGLSFASYSVRKLPESVSSGIRATALKPDSFEAHLLLGKSYRLTKDFVKSEASLKQAVKLAQGESADAHWHLALLYGKDLLRYADAAGELEEFLKAAPEAPNKEAINKLIRQFRDKAKAGA